MGTMDSFVQPASGPVTKQSADLMKLIRSSGRLDIRDRLYRLRRYRSTFLGSELVDLLCKEYCIGRVEAVRIGRRLLALDLIAHVTGEHDFQDSPLFYVVGTSAHDAGKTDLSVHSVRQLLPELRGASGLQPGKRRRFFIDYPNCFSGRELVDWICAQTGVGRDDGFAAGQAMLHGNLVRHVLDEEPFHDNGTLYCFV
jgi:hypothetical protein